MGQVNFNEDHLNGLISFMNTFSGKMGDVPIPSNLFDRSREILSEMAKEGYWSGGQDEARISTNIEGGYNGRRII